jgi:hypothetical protein
MADAHGVVRSAYVDERYLGSKRYEGACFSVASDG